MFFKKAYQFLEEVFTAWGEDRGARLAAAIAYYTLFALAPLVVLVIYIAGMVFGTEEAQAQLFTVAKDLAGQQSAETLRELVSHRPTPSAGIVATLIGLVTLLVGAGSLFSQLQDALNTIWGAKSRSSHGFWGAVKEYLLSYAMVLGIGLVEIASLFMSGVLNFLDKHLHRHFPQLEILWGRIDFGITLGLVLLLFTLTYKVLPNTPIRWKDALRGSLLATFLYLLGKAAFGFYLSRNNPATLYGAAGSLVLLLIWVYVSAQILLFGAEFAKVMARREAKQKAEQEKGFQSDAGSDIMGEKGE